MSDLRPGVLFDVDGTLLDTNYLHVIAWWEAMREVGHPEVTMAAIHRSVGIASGGLTERLLGSRDDKAVEAHSERYEAMRERDGVPAFPRAGELVARCAERGLTPVLATSGKEDDLAWMLPAIGAEDSFAGATTSSQVENGKPQPDMLTASLEEYDLDPARTALVGDTIWDVQAAERAGIACIGVLTGGISEAELREAGAVEVYDDVADLLARFDDSLLARFAG
jgi:phosphoglycolate phosphatase-like HAD superfamily hydrolase